jgi:apolipoprotein N-acyltransferase
VAAALLALVLLQWPGLPAVPTQSSGEVAVSLLQGNIAQGEKFDTAKGVPEALAWYGDELLAARERLVVAPETAIPLLPAQLPEDYWQALRARFAQGESAALVGIPLGSHEAGYRNAVVGLRPGADGPPYEYAKHHLVPFGEFIPPGFRWFTELMRIPLGDLTPGALDQHSLAWAGQRWAPNICYEDLFGDELAARFVDPARAPTVMVNLSNIGWFGNGIAIDQHRSISRMRALELARPMIRATNTGATAIIGADGRVQHELPRATRGVLRARVQGREGITPYAWWAGRWGDAPLWLLGALLVLIGAWRVRNGKIADRDVLWS